MTLKKGGGRESGCVVDPGEPESGAATANSAAHDAFWLAQTTNAEVLELIRALEAENSMLKARLDVANAARDFASARAQKAEARAAKLERFVSECAGDDSEILLSKGWVIREARNLFAKKEAPR
jgi:hypothetical protein